MVWALKGVGPADILRSIASGLLGPAARTGFTPAPLGLVSHFLLSFLFAAAFVLIAARVAPVGRQRSEEHTSELQSLMRTSYAVFCLKKKTYTNKYLIPLIIQDRLNTTVNK